MTLAVAGAEFGLLSLVIVFAGSRLARYGDVIAERTGLGASWTGLILLAAATSLPELVSGISAVTLAHSAVVGIGNIVGSNMINLVMIAAIDMSFRQGPVFTKVDQGQILAASYGIIMMAVTLVFLVLAAIPQPLSLPTWLYALLISAIYIVAMRSIYVFEKRRMQSFLEEIATGPRYDNISTGNAAGRFALAALAVMLAGTALPFAATDFTNAAGLATSLAGTVLVAISTSLPEVAASLAAVRIGSVDMAVGNVLGSNIFNITILGIEGLLWRYGSFFAEASPGQILSAGSVVGMTAVVSAGLIYRGERSLGRISWSTGMIVAWYVAALVVMYAID